MGNFRFEQNRFDQALIGVNCAGQAKLFDESVRKALAGPQDSKCREKRGG
jgi:hypothetical protein